MYMRKSLFLLHLSVWTNGDRLFNSFSSHNELCLFLRWRLLKYSSNNLITRSADEKTFPVDFDKKCMIKRHADGFKYKSSNLLLKAKIIQKLTRH